jgi:hypothetical protein
MNELKNRGIADGSWLGYLSSRCPAGTVLVTTSVNRLAAAYPHSAGHVEASDPDTIMRRSPTSEGT